MTRTTLVGAALGAALVLGALVIGHRVTGSLAAPAPGERPLTASRPDGAPSAEGFLYGRITTIDGATFEGRLRFGGNQEAFWNEAFNGARKENAFASYVAPGQLPRERHPIEIFGFVIAHREYDVNLRRLFMVRFGDLVRIEARGKDLRVTLKSGTIVVLDRMDASDFDDGVHVWDEKRGRVELDSLRISTIEFLPTPPSGGASVGGEVPVRLHGTVRTAAGAFTGFIAWDGAACVGTDEFAGHGEQGAVRLRFDTLRSIERRESGDVAATLQDGSVLALSATSGSAGIAVEDPRFGRVRIAWKAFQRAEFAPAGSGPAYDDFPPGTPLTGSVTTRAGERLEGRLVYDLDESETIDTLDAPVHGANYMIPLGLIASITLAPAPAPASGGGDADQGAARVPVTLHDGTQLWLERDGDLGSRNAGLLVFVQDRERPSYVRWNDVARVDLDRPPAMYPPYSGR